MLSCHLGVSESVLGVFFTNFEGLDHRLVRGDDHGGHDAKHLTAHVRQWETNLVLASNK